MPSRLELVHELMTLHEEYDRTPTRALMAGQGAWEPDHYQDEFGSWERALRTAGFDPDDRGPERYEPLAELDRSQRTKLRTLLDSNDPDQFFRGQLLAEIHRLAIELGKTPSIIDMREYGRYSDSTYISHFGSWSDAVTEAGRGPNRGPEPVPDSELLAELRRLDDEVDGPLRSRHMVEEGHYSVPTYISHFGSWTEACEEAGVTAETYRSTSSG